MRRLALLLVLLLAACSRAAATPTPTPTPTPAPVDGAIPAAVDEAFCDLTAALPALLLAVGPLAEALSQGDFDPELIRRDGPAARAAIATVRPYLPILTGWVPARDFATTLDAGLRGVDSGLERLLRDENDLLAKANLALAGADVDRALRLGLPALQAEHPEIGCTASQR